MGDSKKRCEECDKPIDDGKLCSKCQSVRLERPIRDWDIEQGLKKDQSAFTKDIIRSATYKVPRS